MADRGAHAGDGPEVGDTRTDAWYWTRLELAIGIGLVLFFGWSLLVPPVFMGAPEPRPWETALARAGFLGMVVGLVWMIRVFRGPCDKPPPWRYRDR